MAGAVSLDVLQRAADRAHLQLQQAVKASPRMAKDVLNLYVRNECTAAISLTYMEPAPRDGGGLYWKDVE